MNIIEPGQRCPDQDQDPGERVADMLDSAALAQVTGLEFEAAIRLKRQRLDAFRDPSSPRALEELGKQLPLLEAVARKILVDAATEEEPARAAELMKAGLQAQQAFARTFALLRGLSGQALLGQGGTGAVVLHDSASSGLR